MSQVCLFKVLKYLYWNFSQMRRNFASYFCVLCNAICLYSRKNIFAFSLQIRRPHNFLLSYMQRIQITEAATRDVLWKKVFLKISQYSQEKHLRQCCRPETNLSKLINLNDIWLIHYIIITLIFIALIHYITFKKLNNQY